MSLSRAFLSLLAVGCVIAGNRLSPSPLAAAGQAAGQSIPIGIIDVFGLRRVPADLITAALTFKAGDAVSLTEGRPPFVTASEARLAAVPGVSRARISLVCCDNGRAIAYIGIEERGSATMSFRAAPKGDVRLAADVVQAGEDLSKASRLATQRGDVAEDRAQGHSLARDPGMRAVQDRYVLYARRDLADLRRVLRESSDDAQRALAAEVLGYAPDKPAVVDDLVFAMSDPAPEVRNNAMRALMVIAEMTPAAGRPVPRIPPQPFVALLNSPIWSDRNKASGALMALTSGKDPRFLEAVRQREAIAALVEMARWKSEGHAQAPFFILARIAGYPEDRAFDLWRRGERETVIKAAQTSTHRFRDARMVSRAGRPRAIGISRHDRLRISRALAVRPFLGGLGRADRELHRRAVPALGAGPLRTTLVTESR